MNLFEICPANSQKVYKNVFEAETDMMVAAKKLCVELWELYQPHADEHFIQEVRLDFCGRFWEMDLACFFLKQERNMRCPKPGPDIKIDNRIWIEAISARQGVADNPNSVPDIISGEVSQVDGNLIKLRYTAAIAEKFKKYRTYLDNGIIEKDEPYIIALNSSQIPRSDLDDSIPRIAKTLLAIGDEFVTLDRETHKQIGSGHHYQQNISKKSGSEVSTNTFLDPKYAGISAVLYSNSDPFNRARKDGQGYLLIHNPLANNPIDQGFLRAGKEIVPTIQSETDYSLRFITLTTD
jgi:type I restriction enzyme S subunit